MTALPIDGLREEVVDAVRRGPLVLAAPTGSGKSTQVPRWLPGRVVMIEPRRVACRSLAARIAELEGEPLGESVGYRVRGEARRSARTRIELMTPGIALRDLDAVRAADAVILDEFHERRLDTDLLLGLLDARPGLLVMSATIDGPRVASHLGGAYLEGEGRLHPVEVRYLGAGAERPRRDDLAARVRDAVVRSAVDPGDVLVFLPGRAEIDACAVALSGLDLDVRPLHGRLRLEEQTRAFEAAGRRKVVLATNVAETSITIPGIGVVIDAGLVRRTRYHRGRAFLTLAAVAKDSAEQRAGRAGRTGPGIAYRLWSEAAVLEPRTPPEIHRESLVPMMLAAANVGRALERLRLLDAPKDYAVADAREELTALGALDAEGGLTAIGEGLFTQPLDPAHARLVIEALEARARGEDDRLGDVIDLVSALAVGRPLFTRPVSDHAPEDDLREAGCDVVAILRAMREGEPRRHGLDGWVLGEARREARRMRRAHGLDERDDGRVDRRALARLFLRADPRIAHVARRRKHRLALASGGTEASLGRESAAQRVEAELEAACVLESRALDAGRSRGAILATCVMPVPVAWLAEAGLGRERVGRVAIEDRRVIATVERVFAKRVLETREEAPRGALAREAIASLVLDGRLLKGARARVEEGLRDWGLAARLRDAGREVHGVPLEVPPGPVPTAEAHLLARLEELGVESGDDAALLAVDDLAPPELAPWVRDFLDREYPRSLALGDAFYEIDYDLGRRQVILRMVRGTRDTAPPASYLPRFEGLRVCVESRRAMHVVRER